MTLTQLDPQFHVYVPDADDYMLVWFVIDYHSEEHLYWVGAMQRTGEVWTLSNDKIRACRNPSVGRSLSDKPPATPFEYVNRPPFTID